MTQSIDLPALRNLKAMIGGDPEDLVELVGDFVSALPQQMARMRELGEAADWANLRITAHSCNSNARDLGALHLSQLCAQLEAESAAADVHDLQAQLREISAAVDIAIADFSTLDLADV